MPASRNTLPFKMRYTFIFIILLVFIGFRKEIGVDWNNYEEISKAVIRGSVYESLFFYYLIHLISNLDISWYYINVFSAVIFLSGLFVFINKLERPSLALLYALPYFIVIVAMGYTRQAISLGIFMYVIPNLYRKEYYRYILGIVIGSMFHVSVFLLVFLPVVITRRKSWKSHWLLLIAAVLSLPILYVMPVHSLIERYLFDNQLVSKGAQARLFIYSIISVAFMLLSNLVYIEKAQKTILLSLSYISPILFLATFLGLSTTLADRFALFSYPSHFAFFSLVPSILKKDVVNARLWMAITTIFSLLLFALWIAFTIYLDYWFPYRNYIVCPNECL